MAEALLSVKFVSDEQDLKGKILYVRPICVTKDNVSEYVKNLYHKMIY